MTLPPAPFRLDGEGFLDVGSHVPQMLRLFLEDLGCQPAAIQTVQAAIEDVRRGRRSSYVATGDLVRLLVTPERASFTIAAKLTRNAPVAIPLADLEDAVTALRDFALSLPDEQRW